MVLFIVSYPVRVCFYFPLRPHHRRRSCSRRSCSRCRNRHPRTRVVAVSPTPGAKALTGFHPFEQERPSRWQLLLMTIMRTSGQMICMICMIYSYYRSCSRSFRADRFLIYMICAPVAGWVPHNLHHPRTCFLGWICTIQILHNI